VILVALVALVLVVAVAAIAFSVRRSFERDNEVLPGVTSGAPAAWAGAHTPEAKLHRRLRDAVAALPAPDDIDLIEAVDSVRRLAQSVDERLIAVARLPESARAARATDVSAAVDGVEAATAAVVDARQGLGPAAHDELRRQLADLDERVALLAEARGELGA
jgi:hypothetical protein